MRGGLQEPPLFAVSQVFSCVLMLRPRRLSMKQEFQKKSGDRGAILARLGGVEFGYCLRCLAFEHLNLSGGKKIFSRMRWLLVQSL